MIVMKFGGSSVESAVAIARVASIVKTRLARKPVVVVSAMGKTTNRLLAIAEEAIKGNRDAAIEQLTSLEKFHLQEGGEIGGVVAEHFKELGELIRGLAVLGELTPRSIDAISAYGERLSSLIVAEVFRQNGIDAIHQDSRDYVITDDRHTQCAPLYPETYTRLETLTPLVQKQVVVMGGFIGSTTKGITSTLGRGGSDFSASIIGAGIGAEEIQIWTDVDGMLTCDPRILTGGHRIKTISFAEAAELAYFGAKVLHPSTVVPAIEHNIPVIILNSRRPDVSGTRIIAESAPSSNPVKAIACKRDITSVNIKSTRMLMAHGFLRRIFEVFDHYETPVDLVTTSEISVSLTIDNLKNIDRIVAELRGFSEVTVIENQALVCLVGDSIGTSPGVAGRVFKAVSGINIRMISQGASLLNLSFVIDGADLEKAMNALHSEFFSELDANVFDRFAA